MTSEIELDEVDWTISRRATPLTAFSIGFVTCSVTSDEPAPGNGVTTVTIGKSMSGRSSCLRLPQAEMPAMNRAPAKRSVTLRLLRAMRLRRLTFGAPPCDSVVVAPRSMARWKISSDWSTTASSSASSRPSSSRSWRWLSSRNRSSSATAPGVTVMTTWRRLSGSSARCSRSSSTSRSTISLAEDEPIAETGGELGHAQLAGRHHDVQDLGLGHRDPDLGELGRVRADEALHHLLVAVEDGLDGGRPMVVGSSRMECSVTPYCSARPYYIPPRPTARDA